MRHTRTVSTWYEVIGVSETADHTELRRAYRARAQLLHPDTHHAGSADELARSAQAMQELNAAWAELGDRQRRVAYDATLAAERQAAANAAAARRAPRPTAGPGRTRRPCLSFSPPLVRAR